MKSTEKKQTYFLRAAMMVLTTILIVLFFIIISLVSKIQGTARVINYAGLVRGGTQLMVKLEISQEPQDEKYREISDYIEGLRYGSEELNPYMVWKIRTSRIKWMSLHVILRK